MGAGATPQYCYEFWRAQRYERIVRAPLLAINDFHTVCSRHWQVAVNQFGLGFRKLISSSKAKLMHTLSSDRLVEASHLPFEERLTISVRRRISAEDVPPVGDELSADCAGNLVAGLAPVDHRPSPFAELRVRARGEDRLAGFGEEELHFLPSLSVKRFVKSAASLRILLLVSAGIDNRREAPVGRELRGLGESVRILDGGLQRERALVVDALELHQLQHPRIGEDDLGDPLRERLFARKQTVVVFQQRLELLFREASDPGLGDHRPECGGLGLPALDRKLVALAATDAPDAVRDPRHLLRRVAVGEHDVAVFRVPVGRRPDEFVNVALDVGERQVLGIHDVADPALALLVRDGVGPDYLRTVSGFVEHPPEVRRVGRGLDDGDRVEVDVPLVRRDHGFDVHALNLPVEAGIESVRPVPDGDGQLLRVGVHADHEPGFVFGAAAPQLSFCAHCATLWVLSRIGVGGLQGCIQVSEVFRLKQVVSAGAQTDPRA